MFEDAKIITNIIIAEKNKEGNKETRFIFLKKKIEEIIGNPPPATDTIANEKYYTNIRTRIFENADKCKPDADKGYKICENQEIRVVAVTNNVISMVEEKIGRLGVFRGPSKYLETVLEFIEDKEDRLIKLGDIIDLKRELTTNANDLFYLPSKYWTRIQDTSDYLVLLNKPEMKQVKISKDYLRRLIKLQHLKNTSYHIETLPLRGKEDYVIWVDKEDEVKDLGMKEYIEWMKNHIEKEYRLSNGRRYPTIYRKMCSSKSWLKLPDVSNRKFIFREIISRNFSIWFNGLRETQIDHTLFAGEIIDKYSIVDTMIMFGILNSTFTYLGLELLGRANLGEGALKVEMVDYIIIPLPHPLKIKEFLTKNNHINVFLEAVNTMLHRKPENIEKEIKKPDRLTIDELLLGSLGFSRKEVRELYNDLLELVNIRTQRSSSIIEKS